MNIRMKPLNVFALTIAMMSGVEVQAKRLPPKEIPPVISAGVQYKVPHFAALHGKNQNGGYVQAWNARTQKLLWDRMIYRIRYNPDHEKDVQDVFITEIHVSGKRLLVKNERSEEFEMDLASGCVRALTKLGPQTQIAVVPGCGAGIK